LLKSIGLFFGVFILAEIWKINPQYPLGMLLFGLKSILFFGGSIFVIYRFRLSGDIRSMVEKGLNKISKRMIGNR
jgi:hypothetical protein